MTKRATISPEDLALELGATIEYADGTTFNSSGRSGIVRLVRQQEPTPAPAQQPAEDGHAKLTAALAEMMSKLHVQQAAPQPAPVVNVPPAQVVVNQQPRCSWDFLFTRNSDGSIKSIRAVPVKE